MIDVYHILIDLMNEAEACKRFRMRDYSGVDFGESDLRNVGICDCDLRGANLSNCIIDRRTCFSNAIFDEKTKMPDYPMACPEKGEFIGWKACMIPDRTRARIGRLAIVKLLVPADARRSSATGKKCRCDKAKILSMERLDDGTEVKEAVSSYDINFVYETGKTVSVENFDECRWHECAPGIHFFMNRSDAARYFL